MQAITLPDSLAQRAQSLAGQLGLSVEELQAQAINEFIRSHAARQQITPAEEEAFIHQLNEVYDRVDTSLDPVVMQLQLTALEPEEW